MEKFNQFERQMRRRKYWLGSVVILIGLLILLSKTTLNIPDWVFSWETAFIFIGLVIGIKQRFNGAFWFLLILIGGGSLASITVVPEAYNNIVFPVCVIIFGIYLFLAKFSTRNKLRQFQKMQFKKYHRSYFRHQSHEWAQNKKEWMLRYQRCNGEINSDDYMDITNVFGETNKNFISKNFKGGFLKNVFGQTIVNLTQSDFDERSSIDIQNSFGGIILIVPINWEVVPKIDVVFGGVDDKTKYTDKDKKDKKIILRGRSIFGGIEIRNF